MSYVQNVRVLGDLLFPKKWIQENPNFVEKLPKPGELIRPVNHLLYCWQVQCFKKMLYVIIYHIFKKRIELERRNTEESCLGFYK
jgi:hypothetical protein